MDIIGINPNQIPLNGFLGDLAYQNSNGITINVGTTAVALNRASANQALTGISSIALPGSTSGTITLLPTAVAGTTTLTLPATTGTLITTGDSATVTNTMLAGAIANAKLANSTISGVALGSNLNTLTIGTGLSGTSYNGSGAVTIAIDSTVATLTGTQTLTNKTLTAPVLGVATATSINKVAITAPATGSTLTIADGKTLTVNNTLTFTGTDASSIAFGAGGTVAYTSNINAGTLTLGIGTAGATNTTVTVGTGTGFHANTASVITYDIKVGPALTALASIMTGATTGIVKKTAADTYALDTNTYLVADDIVSLIGRDQNQVPLNQYLGQLAYQNKDQFAILPQSSVQPQSNGELTFQLTSDSLVEVKVKGSDGTVRSAGLSLSTTATGYQPLDNDLTAIAALTGNSGILKKTAADTWTLDTNTYLTASQAMLVTNLYTTTSNATNTALTTTGGAITAANQLNIPSDATVLFKGSIVARNTTNDSDSKCWEIKGAIRRGATAATTSLIGTPVIDLIASDGSTWSVTITADTTNGALTVNGVGEASKTIQWSCVITTTTVIA